MTKPKKPRGTKARSTNGATTTAEKVTERAATKAARRAANKAAWAAKAQAEAVEAKPKTTTLRCGAVSAYTTELAMEIAWRTAEGKSLRAIAADPGMPGLRTITEWESKHPEFQHMLDRARLIKADRRLERIDDYSRQV